MQDKKKTVIGTKARQRSDTEDRGLAYRDWRREAVSKGMKRSTCYTSDIDQVEYVIVKDQIYPAALLEITRYDFDEYDRPSESWDKYRSAIINRYFFRDAQGKFIRKMSELVGVPAFIVLFRNDVESFWLFDVTDKDALWIHKDAEEYKDWLAKIKTNTIKKIKEQQDDSNKE